MNVKLSPFVYKVKGKKNYLLFDALKGAIYSIVPEGTIEELKKELLVNDLVIETDGVIPIKFTPDVTVFKSSVIIRELQIRITGRCDRQCESCGRIGECYKEDEDMSLKTLEEIVRQLEHVPIETVVLVGGNPLLRMDVINIVKEKIKATSVKVFLKNADLLDDKVLELKNKEIAIIDRVCEPPKISEDHMELDVSKFFYNQDFNPCWGHKIAIDLNGDIKPCLWAATIVGNIHEHNIRELIFSGRFDFYWELTKEKFEVCRDCEYRYSCSDCRVATKMTTGSLLSKTSYCHYNPETGDWKCN